MNNTTLQKSIGKINQRFDESTPIEQIEAVIPPAELDELSAIGDMRDDQRWKIGDKARLWTDDYHLPAMQIYKIIGRRTDYGHERIRQFCYTSRYYLEHPELRDKYLNLRYSIFEYARGCSDPEAVLRAAYEKNLTPTVVKENYPVLLDEFRDLVARVPKAYETQAREIVQMAIGKLRELVER